VYYTLGLPEWLIYLLKDCWFILVFGEYFIIFFLLLQGKCQLVSEHFMMFKKNDTNYYSQKFLIE